MTASCIGDFGDAKIANKTPLKPVKPLTKTFTGFLFYVIGESRRFFSAFAMTASGIGDFGDAKIANKTPLKPIKTLTNTFTE